MLLRAFLNFYFKHKADYAEWTGSEEYKALHALVDIQTAAKSLPGTFALAQPFNVCFGISSHLIKEVEDFYVVPLQLEQIF
jgi:hypothetical protein